MKPYLLFTLCAVLPAAQAHSEGLLPAHRISADLANQAVAAAVTKCASQGYAETAVLVDADGVQQAVLRGDRAGAHTLDSAFSKAFTAASFKTGASALVEALISLDGRFPVGRPGGEFGGIQGRGDKISLSDVTAECEQQIPMRPRLDPLGH
jgi:hypothetical protein